MDNLFKTILTIHIISGSVGLFTGTINLLRKKGDRNHKLIGKIFAYAMLLAGFSSLALSIMHTNVFLFITGVFTVYMVSTGYRYLYLKMLGNNEGPKMLDWVITIAMLLAGLVFIALGIERLVDKNNFGIVYIVFGLIGLGFVTKDFNNYRGKLKEKNYWLLAHLQRMIGAYIASMTAFFAVNFKYFPVEIPEFVVWLLPSAILGPLIYKWSTKYSVKLKPFVDNENK